MWINEETLKTYKLVHEIRADFPEVSLPPALTDEILASIGVLSVEQTVPTYNPITHSVREIAPAMSVEGRYEQQWEVYALSAEEQEANQAAAAQALQHSIVDSTQQRLDAFARTRNYDGILSACTYATSTVPKFQAEGQYAVQVRDATWAALYAFMADVQAGTRSVPSGFEDVEPLLPALEWPV